MAFHALVRSKLDYVAPAWQSWLSNTNLSCLDRLQNRSFRLITGQLVSTPLQALRLEADVQSYLTRSNRLILKAKEKAMRSTDDYPGSAALDVNIPQRLLNRSSFRRKAEEISATCHPNFNTDKTSFIFHHHHGRNASLTKSELPPLFLESLAEQMTST